jgi:S-adenosyl-L-methionine hydrolase (adenosine-forming)
LPAGCDDDGQSRDDRCKGGDVASDASLAAVDRVFERARTFGDLPPGAAFWYENSNGLAEISVNLGRADRDLGLAIGVPVKIVS